MTLSTSDRMVVAFDYGMKYIGIAVGQRITTTANALPAITAKEGSPDWRKIHELIQEWRPDCLVVGMPVNMDGSISDMAIRARKFGETLEQKFDIPWFPIDERLSSYGAKSWAKMLGKKKYLNPGIIDSMAAQLLLESWLNSY